MIHPCVQDDFGREWQKSVRSRSAGKARPGPSLRSGGLSIYQAHLLLCVHHSNNDLPHVLARKGYGVHALFLQDLELANSVYSTLRQPKNLPAN